MLHVPCSAVLSHGLFLPLKEEGKNSMTFNIDDTYSCGLLGLRQRFKKDFIDRMESAPVYYIKEVPIIYKLSSSPIIEIQSRGRKGFCKSGAVWVKSTQLCSNTTAPSRQRLNSPAITTV